MLTLTLAFDDAAARFHASLTGLPVDAKAVALYRNQLGQAPQLLTIQAIAPGAATAEVYTTVAGDGVYHLQAVALDALPAAGTAPAVLDQSAETPYQLTLAHRLALSTAYASHAGTPARTGASLALVLRRFARLTEATTAYQEGDFYHAHAYLQTP